MHSLQDPQPPPPPKLKKHPPTHPPRLASVPAFPLCPPPPLPALVQGLGREQRRQLAALEYSRQQQEKEQAAAKRSMEAALAGPGGASWGQLGGEDAFDPNDTDNIDWRAYVEAARAASSGLGGKAGGAAAAAASGVPKLNDKQLKMVEKIRLASWGWF